MDKNFLTYQVNSYKELVDLLNYEFTSQSNSYKLFDMVKTHLIVGKDNPILSDIITERSANNDKYFARNFSPEFQEVFYNADNFDVVAKNFVSLFYAYCIYENKRNLVIVDYSDFTIENREVLDINNIGYVYTNDYYKTVSSKGTLDLEDISLSNYGNIQKATQSSSSLIPLELKLKDKFILSEPFKAVLIDHESVKGLIPLVNFSWDRDDTNKQILFECGDSSWNYERSYIDDTSVIQINNAQIKKCLDDVVEVQNKKSANYGNTYIDKINSGAICKSLFNIYALSQYKDSQGIFLKTGINIFFNKERTVSAVVDGYNFIHTLMMLSQIEKGDFCEMYYDADQECIYILGSTKNNIKIQTGFDSATFSPIYDFVDMRLSFKIPTITKDYPSVFDEVWLFQYSASASIKEIIEFTKEEEDDVIKINIPTDFLNQKEIINKEQLFKIETIEDKISSLKTTGKEYLDKVVDYCEEYVLTYADLVEKEIVDERGNIKKVKTYATKESLPTTFLYDKVVNYDYVWKVNELFWKYNQSITIRELIAFFVAKGDNYNYRLLSYRILGIDCYTIKSKLLEQLLIESLVFIEKFNINIDSKTIETPMEITYKYEYATGNYYEKRRNLRPTNTANMSVFPMYESIEMYFSKELAELILQNQIAFIDNELVKPKEMTWASKSEQTKLLCSPIDPIFVRNINGIQELKNKGQSYSNLVLKQFHSYLSRTQLVNSSITRQEMTLGYTMRLPESVTLPLAFLSNFNCFKISILTKEHPKNTKGEDVFAVFGAYDLTLEEPLFIGDDTTNDKPCKDFINYKPNGGSIALARKRTKSGDGGTYLFSKTLKNLTSDSYINLYQGKFISETEYRNQRIDNDNKKKILNEILIAFNQKQSKVIMEGDYQFNKYMVNKVDDIDALKVQQIWNETYNYEMYPKKYVKVEGFSEIVTKLNNEKFPIFVEHSRFFGKETQKEFLLNNNQIDGIKFYVGNKNSGLLAHEVGFGKTSTSICSISHQLLTGQAKRIMISVPNPVYVNFIREIKGEKSKEGYLRRGLLPNVDVVELKNARKDVFIKYDKKTLTQTGGVKKYSKNQITNINAFRGVVKSIVGKINPSAGKYNLLFIDDFLSYKENTDNFVKEIEKIFDKDLIDWRADDFFYEVLNIVAEFKDEFSDLWREELSDFNDEIRRKTNKINDNDDLTQKEKDDKIAKINDDYDTKKEKRFTAICKEFTISVVSRIKSSEQQIYDRIGVYDECFMKSNSIVMCTHEAIGQLRLDKNTANDVSFQLKDNDTYKDVLLDSAISYKKLNVDSIIIDEIHNFNELYSFAKRQISTMRLGYRRGTAFRRSNYDITEVDSYGQLTYAKKRRGNDLNNVIKYNLSGKYTSPKKATLYGICKDLHDLQKQTGTYNVMLLSATPFVDDLFQMMGVFNMLRPFEMPIEFFANYLYQDWDWENDHKGETVLKVQTSSFKNDEARNNWIKLYSQFYTYDERINANRPNKFTYPYDCNSKNITHYQDNCDTNVYLDFTKEQYEIYQNIGKYLEGKLGYDSIVSSKKGRKIDVSVEVEDFVIEAIKDCLNEENKDLYSPEEAVKIFVENNCLEVIKDKKNPQYNQIMDIYSLIETDVQNYLGNLEDEIAEESSKNEDDGQAVEDINDADTISGIGKDDGGTRALRGQDLGRKLAISPYLVTPKDAEDGNINPILPELYGYKTPQERYASAKNFVETSPKLYFICQSIKSLVDYHIENKQDITGQIIYMSLGQKFVYGGVNYDGMDLIKTYLEEILDMKGTFIAEETDEIVSETDIKCGGDTIQDGSKLVVKKKEYKLSQIQIIRGTIQDPLYKNAIATAFNEGKIKVLIGSSTIKEGINLQGSKEFNHGNSNIYIVSSDYAPMVYMQLEGRVWRQGNPLENVRMVYPLIKNSIDLHVYSKLKEKITKVKNMLEAGIYNFKETQFEKDIEGVSLVLNTNIEEKLKVLWSKYERKINEEKKSLDSINLRLDKVKSKYGQIISALDELLPVFNKVSKSLQDYYASTIMKAKFDIEKKKINYDYTNKREQMAKLLSQQYDKDLAVYEAEKEKNEKLNEANKKAKLPLVDFKLVKPLKKDDKYIPDYASLDAQQDKDLEKAKETIMNDVLNNVAMKVYGDDEMYYHVELNSSMPYSEIAVKINDYINNTTTVTIGTMAKSFEKELDDLIKKKGYYYAFDSKSQMLMYAYTKETEGNNANQIITLLKNLGYKAGYSDISFFDRFSSFQYKDLLNQFVGAGAIESIMSDYQEFIYTQGKTISDIDLIIQGYTDKINELNTKISQKNEFLNEKRKFFIDEDEKIKKEREKLTDMKDYVMVDVIKLSKTNKFIYMKGSMTQEEKNDKFAIKK